GARSGRVRAQGIDGSAGRPTSPTLASNGRRVSGACDGRSRTEPLVYHTRAMTEPTITADRDALPPQRPPHADLSTPYRTHTCGELRATDAGLSVKVAGWVHRRRDHGHLIFLDLRDRHGIVQVVLDQHEASAAHEIASRVRNEFVV